MNIFVERQFLDFFRNNCDERKPTHQVFLNFGRQFCDIKWHFDFSISTQQEFSFFKEEYPYFVDLNYLDNQKVDFFINNRIEYPFFIFTKEDKEWFHDAEQKGFFCVSWNNYDTKIESLLNIDFQIDLSQEEKFSWKWFKRFNHIPCTQIIVNDNYILTNTYNQKIEQNIISFFNRLIGEWKNIEIQIFTKKEKMSDEFEKQMKNHQKLKNIPYIIIDNGSKFHDRYVYSNYFYITCGKGFNLIPHKQEDNNSDICTKSILDYYVYRKMSNHIKMLKNHKESVVF